jgi:hypothetical protein
MTQEKPTLEEIGEMPDKQVATIFNLHPYDARLLKKVSSDPFCLKVLTDHEFSLQDMADILDLKIGEVARGRHLLIENGYETEKKKSVNNHRSPECERILSWLQERARFKCASYEGLSKHLGKQRAHMHNFIGKLKSEGKVKIVKLQRRSIVYLPGSEELLGEYVTRNIDTKSLGRYGMMVKTRELRRCLPQGAFDVYYKKTHKTDSKPFGRY